MQQHSVWNGTQAESLDLAAAINRNCTCQYGLDGERTMTCAPHHMLIDDQRALDGLLFFRRIAERLKLEELNQPSPTNA
jgi:hypothetical protein